MLPYHWARRAAYWKEHGRHVEVLDCSRHGVVIVAVVIHSDAHPCIADGGGGFARIIREAVAKAFMEAEIYVDVYSRRPWKKRIRPGCGPSGPRPRPSVRIRGLLLLNWSGYGRA